LNPHILDEITTPEELSGFLNVAIKALKRLLKNGKFSISPATEEIREDYIRKSDPVKAFCMDMLVQDAESWVSKQDLYSAFTEYCRKMKLPPVTQKTFFQNLHQHVTVIDYQPKVNGKRVRAFKGIKLATKIGKDDSQTTLEKDMHAHDVQDAQDSGISKKDTAFSKKEYSENLHMVHTLCIDPSFIQAIEPLNRLLYGWCDNCCVLDKNRKVTLSHKAVMKDNSVLLLCAACVRLIQDELDRRRGNAA